MAIEIPLITFVDTNPEVVFAMREVLCRKNRNISCIHGNILDYDGSLVSPSNSYGNMDGGIDRLYREVFSRDGFDIENEIKAYIEHFHGGKLNFGKAQIVPTYDEKNPYIIFSPTIEKPGDLANAENVKEAMQAILGEVIDFNKRSSSTCIDSIDKLLVPGLGTGYGQLDPEESAGAILSAYCATLKKHDPEAYKKICE